MAEKNVNNDSKENKWPHQFFLTIEQIEWLKLKEGSNEIVEKFINSIMEKDRDFDHYEKRILTWTNKLPADTMFTITSCAKGTGIHKQSVWKRMKKLTQLGYFAIIYKPMGPTPAVYRLTNLQKKPYEEQRVQPKISPLASSSSGDKSRVN